jgi:hypothetical protein
VRRTSIDAQKRPAMSLIDARRDIPDSIAKGKEAITRNSRDRHHAVPEPPASRICLVEWRRCLYRDTSTGDLSRSGNPGLSFAPGLPC